MPSLSCSLDIPSSSRCCSASLRMPSLSGTLGAGLTGKANGKCFCNRHIASTAGSCSRGFVCKAGSRLRCLVLSVLTCCFSARRRSRSSASCSKPIVQLTASWLFVAQDYPMQPFGAASPEENAIKQPFTAHRSPITTGSITTKMATPSWLHQSPVQLSAVLMSTPTGSASCLRACTEMLSAELSFTWWPEWAASPTPRRRFACSVGSLRLPGRLSAAGPIRLGLAGRNKKAALANARTAPGLVPEAGIEPARPRSRGIFLPLRLSPPTHMRCSWSGARLHHSPAAVGARRLLSTPSQPYRPGLARRWLGYKSIQGFRRI